MVAEDPNEKISLGHDETIKFEDRYFYHDRGYSDDEDGLVPYYESSSDSESESGGYGNVSESTPYESENEPELEDEPPGSTDSDDSTTEGLLADVLAVKINFYNTMYRLKPNGEALTDPLNDELYEAVKWLQRDLKVVNTSLRESLIVQVYLTTACFKALVEKPRFANLHEAVKEGYLEYVAAARTFIRIKKQNLPHARAERRAVYMERRGTENRALAAARRPVLLGPYPNADEIIQANLRDMPFQ